MNILGIDTSTERATVALMAQGKIQCAERTNIREHAQWLLPMIDELLNKSHLTLDKLDGIAFGSGPGSFTGLRVACSIAKALAYAHDLPLFPVTSLQAIAADVFQQNTHPNHAVLTILDARMHEVYWAYFDPVLQGEIQVSSAKDIVLPSNKPFILAGVGIDSYAQQLSQGIQQQIFKQYSIYPSAQAMIRLVQSGEVTAVNASDALPIYVRNQVTQGEPRG